MKMSASALKSARDDTIEKSGFWEKPGFSSLGVGAQDATTLQRRLPRAVFLTMPAPDGQQSAFSWRELLPTPSRVRHISAPCHQRMAAPKQINESQVHSFIRSPLVDGHPPTDPVWAVAHAKRRKAARKAALRICCPLHSSPLTHEIASGAKRPRNDRRKRLEKPPYEYVALTIYHSLGNLTITLRRGKASLCLRIEHVLS